MAEGAEITEPKGSLHEEPLEKTIDLKTLSSPVDFKFASPDVDVESAASSGVVVASSGIKHRRKPSATEAQEDLKAFSRIHMLDPNLDQNLYRKTKNLAAGNGDADEKIDIDMKLAEDSPYPEVRAAVPNTDDPSIPCNTIRMWTISFIFCTIGSGINMLLSLRRPSIVITSIVAQLLSFPVGKAWGNYMPAWEFTVFGKRLQLNPGPFNMKEHCLIVVAANVSYGGGAAYATDIILAQKVFYGQDFGGLYSCLLVISTQCIGYAFAGIMRRFLVWPAAMLWPSNLINTTLFHTLFRDAEPEIPGWKISRYRWFMYIFAGMFIWNWIPGYLFQAVSNFAFVTWIRPDNVVLNQVFGSVTGLDIIPLTVDWSQITGFLSSPLMTPFWAIGNVFVAFVFWIWIVTPILHFTNVWYGKYMPISTPVGYDNTGNMYQVKNVLNDNFEFDLAKYQAYSPLFLGTTFALAYGLSFGAITSVLVHTYLFYGSEIWRQFKAALDQEDDIHMKLNKAYPQAPDWWYLALGLVMFGIAIGICEGYDNQMTWWAVILSLIMGLVFFIPVGIIQAISNVQVGLNVITEFVAAYALPGRPIANMTFKTYGYMAMSQGLTFTQDLKLGHYMHVPPIMMFSVQVLATIWGGLVNVGVLYWAFGSIKGICTSDAVQNFTCPNATTFFTASVVWGILGPQRLFSKGELYYPNLYFFLIGAIVPIPIYLLARRYPSGPWKFINTPILFSGTGSIPPATAINYASWSIIGFIFNYWIKRRSPAWWAKYNYVTSAGLDCGLAICLIIIFLALSLPNGGINFNWWGNVDALNTADANGVPMWTVGENETFGPTSW